MPSSHEMAAPARAPMKNRSELARCTLGCDSQTAMRDPVGAASIWRAIPFVGVLLDAQVGKALADGELFARLHRRAEGCAKCRALLAARSCNISG